MRSLVILMIEEEQPEGLSARKLVVETVKHNVLTAYNAQDGIDLLRRFPAVDAVLVHAAQIEEASEPAGRGEGAGSPHADYSGESVCAAWVVGCEFCGRQP